MDMLDITALGLEKREQSTSHLLSKFVSTHYYLWLGHQFHDFCKIPKIEIFISANKKLATDLELEISHWISTNQRSYVQCTCVSLKFQRFPGITLNNEENMLSLS